MKRTLLFALIATGLLSTGLSGAVLARGGDDSDVDKVNGSIHLPENSTAGKLSTVNGSIHVGANSHVRNASTVNGGVEIGGGSQLDSVETVNGGVSIGEKVKVAKTVETVNGSISLDSGADVAGKVSNVNGGIRLDTAHIGGGLETASGDINIGANSHIEGGIVVDEDRSWLKVGNHKPRVVVGPHATVQGKMTFKREVDLFVSDSATVGAIEGATATKFSGDKPQD
jgi:DUF4097 and DUF4098 domain-containing protein YvlB